jgi:medium-chain acyl-[acyl-carrier-protein] hydrolase
MEKQSTGTEIFKVRSYQMDMKGRASLTAIAGYLQESAGNHAHQMGFGFEQMSKSGFIWALTRLKIKVHDYPHWSEGLLAETWVVNREKFFSRRDFEIRSSTNKLLVSAVSGWMLLDMKNKRPQLVDNFPMDIEFFPNRLALPEDTIKIDELAKADYQSQYKVIYSDIDIVSHVNNVQYLRIILDAQSYDLRSKNHVKSFEINYIAEALINDELIIFNQNLSTENYFLHEIQRISDKKVICRAISCWEKD